MVKCLKENSMSVLSEIINIAIIKEHEAAKFYTSMQSRQPSVKVQHVLKSFIDMENAHQRALEEYLSSGNFKSIHTAPDVTNLLHDLKTGSKSGETQDLRDMFDLAIREEESAHTLYKTLSVTFKNETGAASLFSRLADEELSHRNTLTALRNNL